MSKMMDTRLPEIESQFKAAQDTRADEAYHYKPAAIPMWVARDKIGTLYLYNAKPRRNEVLGWGKPEWWIGGDSMKMPRNLFPQLTWQSEPIQVTLLYN